MTSYAIMTADQLASLEKIYGPGIQAADYAFVSPVKILTGNYAGEYAVNTAVYDSDECFEQFRTVFKDFPVVELDLATLNYVADEATSSSSTDSQATEDTSA